MLFGVSIPSHFPNVEVHDVPRRETCSCLLQFFCIHCPYQPNATTMRTKTGSIVDPCDFPEIYVISNLSPTSDRWQTRRTQNPAYTLGFATFGETLRSLRREASLR